MLVRKICRFGMGILAPRRDGTGMSRADPLLPARRFQASVTVHTPFAASSRAAVSTHSGTAPRV
jgi:hypothetical protein